MAKGIIYITTTSVTGLIKIGRCESNRFDKRMNELEQNGYWNVGGLKRYFAVEVDDYCEKEKLMHTLFSKSQVSTSELFALDKDLAKEMGYDHRYVTSLIKKGLDTTFRALLNEYRIQNAQYLLATESKNIAEIAYECGYDSLCSFNRNFKEITGTTPKLFRQK
jgi:AraC-like DNA-binding protein